MTGQTPREQRDAAPRTGFDLPQVLREIRDSSAIISVLSVAAALGVGAVLIVLVDERVRDAAGYFMARPGDLLAAIGDAVGGAYAALFRGAVLDLQQGDVAGALRPLTETLAFATPLVAAGLGVAVAFRVGLFNIGGQGQLLIAAASAGAVGALPGIPPVLHLVLAVAAGVAGGAIWAGIAGVLKARTGAHEVIVTIMLNYVAFYLVSYLLRTPGALQAPGQSNPKSIATLDTAVLPPLLGDRFNLHLGFLLVLLAVAAVWLLFRRSTLGFAFRAIGENPDAARVAGMNVPRMTIVAMLLSGALVGMAGVSQVLGTVTTGFSSGIDAGIGFDAITVALLGRSRPVGVLLAGLLFGALKAGGYFMQAAEGVPIDIVLIVQSVVVLFIAAPPLVRAIFRLPAPTSVRARAAEEVISR